MIKWKFDKINNWEEVLNNHTDIIRAEKLYNYHNYHRSFFESFLKEYEEEEKNIWGKNYTSYNVELDK